MRRIISPNSTFSRIACFLGGVPFVLVAVAGVVTGARAYPIERETTRWTKTWGTLDDARFDASIHSIAVRYTFTANGIRYVGNTLGYGIHGGHYFNLESTADDLERQQSAAGQTAVYYDPRDPFRSCLEVGTSGSIVSFAWSIVAFLLGVSCIHQAFWPRQRGGV